MRQVTLSNEAPVTFRNITVTRTDGSRQTIEVGPAARLEIAGAATNVDGAPAGPASIVANFADVAAIELEAFDREDDDGL